MARNNWAVSLSGLLVLCSGLFSSGVAAEKLNVVGQVGDTISTERYFKLIDVDSALSSFRLNLDNYRENFTKDAMFPLSTSMSPGSLDSLEFKEPKPTVRPFVVIGQDELSEKWLQFRYNDLMEMNATIFVVETSSFDYLKDLKSRFSPLKVAPANGDAIGESLNVRTYPFMVNQYGVWQ